MIYSFILYQENGLANAVLFDQETYYYTGISFP